METPTLKNDKIVETTETPISDWILAKQKKLELHQNMRDVYEASKIEEQRQIDAILAELEKLI